MHRVESVYERTVEISSAAFPPSLQMISGFEKRYQDVSDKVRVDINDGEQTETPAAGSAEDLTWVALIGSFVVLLALSAISAMWAVTWWRRIPSRPLAIISSCGAWMLAGIFAWACTKLGVIAFRSIMSRRDRTPR